MERIPSELLRSHILLCLRVKEFLRFRLVSRAMFKAVTKACIPLLTEDEEVMPRATMINVSSCMFCDEKRPHGTEGGAVRFVPKTIVYILQKGRLFHEDADQFDETCRGGEQNTSLRHQSREIPLGLSTVGRWHDPSDVR